MSLEKVANREALTKEDIITAANELFDLEKQASDADAYGRQLAHDYVNELVKQAEEEKKEDEDKMKVKKEAKKEGESEEMEEAEKKAEFLGAMDTLRKLGIVK